jgi:hypothetical protein
LQAAALLTEARTGFRQYLQANRLINPRDPATLKSPAALPWVAVQALSRTVVEGGATLGAALAPVVTGISPFAPAAPSLGIGPARALPLTLDQAAVLVQQAAASDLKLKALLNGQQLLSDKDLAAEMALTLQMAQAGL